MKRIDHFVPGDQGRGEEVLSRLRWPIPGGVTEAYVKAYTDPGEVVLVPYCQGDTVLREILAAGRRPLALNFDPLLILLARVNLAPLLPRELNAAVARLGDSLKQGVPLRRYLSELYATTCPACLRPAVVDYFIWDREEALPVAKQLRCPACTWDGRAAVDAEDRARLDEVPRQGMHYHYILDRVAPEPPGGALRTRVERLLGLYSPRNLYALAELTIRIENLFPEGPAAQALKALLLDCLDRCSSLAGPVEGRRRRSLAPPPRYLERNVWHAFEEAVDRSQRSSAKPVADLAGDLEAFRAENGRWRGFVGQELIRNLSRRLAPRSLRLIVTSPPPLDSAAWSLSYLWGGWLLEVEAVAPLRPLLRQRTPDPAWYARVMSGPFATLSDLMQDEGRLVLILTEQRPVLVEALLLAASSVHLGVAALVQRGSDYRLELTPKFARPVVASAAPLQAQIHRTAVHAAVETIRARGEPVSWRCLHAAMLKRLAETGLLGATLETEPGGPSPLDQVAEQVSGALQSPAFVQLRDDTTGSELWWLAEPGQVAPPLCDRVEESVHHILHDTLALTRAGLEQALYARFPAPLVPQAALVAACLEAYGQEPTPGYWQLRAEDAPQARQAEQQAMIDNLLALGERLGYRAGRWQPFDVAWHRAGQVQAAFVVRWRAAVSEVVGLSEHRVTASPYLVIPGGRAALISHKLAHNPLWQQVVEEAGWRFIKYRHVRQLLEQPEVDEYTLRTIVGLDPIVEREAVQIPLF